MGETTQMVASSLFAGLTIFIGGLCARFFERCCRRRIESYILHWTVAFGGGALVAAVAFVLTPEAIARFPVTLFSVVFLSGAVVFFLVDKGIGERGGLLAQTLAMLLDFIPEAVALGATFNHDRNLGLLLAFFIGVQNLPESFNAYFDLRKGEHPPKTVLLVFFALSLLGVVSALLGRYLLIDHEGLTYGLMLFCAGGILYLVFQDIAPLSRMKNHWEPALGAIFGFLIGMIGTKLLG